MQLILDTEGVTLKRQDGSFFVTQGDQNRMISPLKITSIAVLSSCLVSAAAVLLAVEHQIPIYFMSATGKPEARLDSVYFQNLPDVRRQQVLFELDMAATQWIISLFHIKKQHQIDNLEYLKNRRPAIAADFKIAVSDMERYILLFEKQADKSITEARQSLLGIEGSIAKTYWQLIGTALNDPSLFDGRSRRPAADNFNSILNYGYGMLYSIVERAVLTVGLDSQLGYFHVDDYAKPTLVFDIIEPFRPWVDRLLLEAFLTDQIQNHFFQPSPDGKGIYLSKTGKAWLIPTLNGWMEEKILFDKIKLARRTHIVRFAGEFVKQLRNFQFIR